MVQLWLGLLILVPMAIRILARIPPEANTSPKADTFSLFFPSGTSSGAGNRSLGTEETRLLHNQERHILDSRGEVIEKQ